jgi:hypothetical protein
MKVQEKGKEGKSAEKKETEVGSEVKGPRRAFFSSFFLSPPFSFFFFERVSFLVAS